MSSANLSAIGRKNWLVPAAVLGLVGFAALAWWQSGSTGGAAASKAVAAAAAAPKPVLTVSVAEPRRETLAISLQANGNVSAWQEASVGAEVNGLRLAQVAQADTPLPWNFSSLGRPRYLAEAPVATISASQVYSPASPTSRLGVSPR